MACVGHLAPMRGLDVPCSDLDRMVNGGRVKDWICINFSRNVQDSAAGNFCHELAGMCQTSGMEELHSSRDEECRLDEEIQEAQEKLRVLTLNRDKKRYGHLQGPGISRKALPLLRSSMGPIDCYLLSDHQEVSNPEQVAQDNLDHASAAGGSDASRPVDGHPSQAPEKGEGDTIGKDTSEPSSTHELMPGILRIVLPDTDVVASQDWPEVTKYAGLVINVQVPFLFKRAIDWLAALGGAEASLASFTDANATLLALFASPAAVLNGYELRNALFSKVTWRAIRSVPRMVFSHLHELDLRYHLSRQTGALNRIIDRGSNAINCILTVTVFNIIPTILEIGMVSSILAYKFGSTFAWITSVSVATYVVFTLALTQVTPRFGEMDMVIDRDFSGSYRAMADDDPRVPGDRTMADEEEEQMPFFSQFSSAGGNLGRGMGFRRFLDLNSNVVDFPELGSYQQLLFDQSAGHGLPPIGPGRGRPMPQGGGGRSRSLNIGGRAGSHLRPFVAPAAAAVEGGVIGRGRTVSEVTGRGVGRANASSSIGSRGKTAGKQRVSSTAAPSEDVDENGGFEDEDDNNGFGEKTIAKADWTNPHITIFCNIAYVRKFKGGNPEYLDMLIELFQGVAVDGSSAYVPLDEDEEEEYDIADDGNEQSPMSTTSKKRGEQWR
ncbi:hypothetical protein ZWY2020_000595 [Hordeum vulgare]|nr:hypothetical protein ZWY2020_000595 [Hordeum vulgare]